MKQQIDATLVEREKARLLAEASSDREKWMILARSPLHRKQAIVRLAIISEIEKAINEVKVEVA